MIENYSHIPYNMLEHNAVEYFFGHTFHSYLMSNYHNSGSTPLPLVFEIDSNSKPFKTFSKLNSK